MFTGIVHPGHIDAIESKQGLMRLSVYHTLGRPAIGASVAHDGVCLTVVHNVTQKAGHIHVVEVAAESLALTTLGALQVGDQVNLERSLRVGDELGGHMVQGHVDGLGEVLSVRQDGDSWRLRVRPPETITHLIAPKGSIAMQGVSLTVNEVDEQGFGVLIIPHTWKVTTLSKLKAGDKVNLEADMMARYAARLIEARR